MKNKKLKPKKKKLIQTAKVRGRVQSQKKGNATARSSSRIKITKEQVDTLIRKGEERGFLTTSEILYAIPNIERNVNELEGIYDQLKERGVEIREAREFLDVGEKKEKKQKKALLGKIDPIQMYLKEI